MKLSRRNFLKRSTVLSATALTAPMILREPAAAAGKPILLGSLLDLSGGLAASGVPMKYALELAVAGGPLRDHLRLAVGVPSVLRQLQHPLFLQRAL
jgi:hypothetical protein